MIPWEPYKPENIVNPYPMYQWLRENDPVHKTINGDYVITKYQDVKQILNDKRCDTGIRLDWLRENESQLSDQLNISFEPLKIALSAFPLFMNGDDHERIKKFMHGVWEVRDYSQLIDIIIDRLAKQITLSDTFNFIETFANKLPLHTISAILGIDQNDLNILMAETKKFFNIMDIYVSISKLNSIVDSAIILIAILENTFELKFINPDESLISAILKKNDEENNPLSKPEVLSVCFSFLAGGKETSSGLIGNAMYYLGKHTVWQSYLKEQPEKYVNFINEIVRFDPPAQLSVRKNRNELHLGNRTIPKNSTLIVSMASANRDEQETLHANEFTIDSNLKNLSFGSGAHYCMGDWLGKSQATALIKYFNEIYHEISVIGLPIYNSNLTIRTLSKLVLQVKP